MWPGEYFSTSIFRGDDYAGSYGAIILSLIAIKASNFIHTVNQQLNEIWYVINNSSDALFCLPVGILQNSANADISSYKMCAYEEKKCFYKKFAMEIKVRTFTIHMGDGVHMRMSVKQLSFPTLNKVNLSFILLLKEVFYITLI